MSLEEELVSLCGRDAAAVANNAHAIEAAGHYSTRTEDAPGVQGAHHQVLDGGGLALHLLSGSGARNNFVGQQSDRDSS